VPKDAIAIFAIVILNGVLGYFQESRAEKALAALKQLASPNVRVLRDGRFRRCPPKIWCPAMFCCWKQGCRWPPMACLLEASNLQVRESALTGEAQAVNKQAEAP
jgi:Ca2+-transporting ATPase